MKLLILMSLLALTSTAAYAQYDDEDVQRVFNTLYNSKEYLSNNRNDTTPELAEHSYKHLYDSVEYAVVNAYILKKVDEKGKFRWPRRVRNTVLSETYRYLLFHEYNIDDAVSSGCVDQHSFKCFDSLMSREIVKKFGDDFFERSEVEAASLDIMGLGLRLPYIKAHKENTVSLIRKAVPLLDTLQIPFFDKKNNVRYLFISFKGNKVEDAYIGVIAWGVQASLELMGYSVYLKHQLNKLTWVGPSFKGHPVKQTVLVDFEEETLNFQ